MADDMNNKPEGEGLSDDLKRLAAEHVIRRVTDEDADGAGAFDAVLHAFQLEGAQAGSHDLDNLLAILIALLARVSASLTGLDAFPAVARSRGRLRRPRQGLK